MTPESTRKTGLISERTGRRSRSRSILGVFFSCFFFKFYFIRKLTRKKWKNGNLLEKKKKSKFVAVVV